MSVLDFDSSVAVVIGIDQYEHGIAPLRTAVADAEAIAQHLQADHDYQVITYLNQQAQLSALKTLVTEKLPKLLSATLACCCTSPDMALRKTATTAPPGT